MILLSSAEGFADYSDKNRNNSKNDNISTRASNDGKREKAVTNLSSSLFPSHCPLRAFFFTSPRPSLLSKKASTDGGESELIVDGFLHLCSVLTLSFCWLRFQLREPPLDGMFVYGIYLWGCAWEKTTGDLLDAPPKSGPTPLPVVHIIALPQTEKAALNDPVRAAVSYSCPCYSSRICAREPVMLLDVDNKDIPSTRWPLRGLSSTLRPF